MQLEQRSGVVAATWILVAGLTGFGGDVSSVSGAAWVLGLGLGPPFLMMLHWGLTRSVAGGLPQVARPSHRPPAVGGYARARTRATGRPGGVMAS